MHEHTKICARALALLDSHITATETLDTDDGPFAFELSARVVAVQLPAVDSGVEVALLLRHDTELSPGVFEEYIDLSALTVLTVNGVAVGDQRPTSNPGLSLWPRRARHGLPGAPGRAGHVRDTASTR